MENKKNYYKKSTTRKSVWTGIGVMAFAGLITCVMVVLMIKPLFNTETNVETNTQPSTTLVKYETAQVPDATQQQSGNYGVSTGGTAPGVATNSNAVTTNSYLPAPETIKKVNEEKETEKPTPTEKPTQAPEKTTNNNLQEYQLEIDEENQRHEMELANIESAYRLEISDCEYMISYNRNIGGYVSSSYYDSQISQLETEIYDKERKLAMYKMDTSGAYKGKARQLEAELQNDYAQLEDLMFKQSCVAMAEQYERELEDLKRQKQYEINAENEKHNEIIQEIKDKYNR